MRKSPDFTVFVAVMFCVLFSYGITDYNDRGSDTRHEAARQARALIAAAGWCAPKPGQRATQEWREGRLSCTIVENYQYGMRPRVVMRELAPEHLALADGATQQ